MGIPNDPVTVNGEPAAYVIAIFARRRGPALIHKSGNLLPVLKRWESSAERVHLYAAEAGGGNISYSARPAATVLLSADESRIFLRQF